MLWIILSILILLSIIVRFVLPHGLWDFIKQNKKSVATGLIIFLILLISSVFDYNQDKPLFFHCDDSQLVTFGENFYQENNINQPEKGSKNDVSRNPIEVGNCDYFTAGERVWGFLSGIAIVVAIITYFYNSHIDRERSKKEQDREDREYRLDYEPNVRLFGIPALVDKIGFTNNIFTFYLIPSKKHNFYKKIYPIFGYKDEVFLAIANTGKDSAKHVKLYFSLERPAYSNKQNNTEQKIDFIDFSKDSVIELFKTDQNKDGDIDTLSQNDFFYFYTDERYYKIANATQTFYALIIYEDKEFKNIYLECYKVLIESIKKTYINNNVTQHVNDLDKISSNFALFEPNYKSFKRFEWTEKDIKHFNPNKVPLKTLNRKVYYTDNIEKLSINKIEYMDGSEKDYGQGSWEKEIHKIKLPPEIEKVVSQKDRSKLRV